MRSKVVIIGAGFAGLSSVVRLKELGFSNILVLEARNDIGGRIRQIKFGGSNYNIGPEWLHGQKSNPIYDLVTNKLGLHVKNSDDYKFYFNKPKNLSISQREMLFKKGLRNLQNIIDDQYSNLPNEILENKSISEILHNYNNIYKTNELLKFVDYWAFNFENGEFSENFSALLYKLSSDIYKDVKAFSDYYFSENDGFLKMIKYFHMKSELNENNIRFNDAVSEIHCKHDKVEIFTKNGNHYLADYCICTVPISIITKRLIKIYPDFDNDIHDTIGKLKFSTYTRIFVELDKPTWINKFDWLVDLSANFKDEICLWQNPDSSNVLIAHTCMLPKQISSNLESKVERSLRNILKNHYKNIYNIHPVLLQNCPFSYGAFPTASSDFNINDLNILKKFHNRERLIFAGDSYTLEYIGTVQGAMNTGFNAADRIFKSLKL